LNKQQLAAKIWGSANQMRSKIEANEYKDYILGFIFYKYLSDQQIQFAIDKGMSTIEIYDPTSGSGSLLINIGNSVAKHVNSKDNIKYFAQELKANTYNLTRMNLVMRGIKPGNILTRNGDTLEDDWPYFDENDPAGSYKPLYVDAVVSNPPYSQNTKAN